MTYKLDEIRFSPKLKSDLIINKYYLIFEEGKWKRVKLSKSYVGKLFKTDKKELQVLASDNQLSINTKDGLVKLFQLLNNQ